MTDIKQFLIDSLDSERRHVLATVEGLTDDQLREVVVPSGWSLMTMLKHLTVGIEHYWFSCIIGGEPLSYFDTDEMRDQGEWQFWPSDTGAELIARYRAEALRGNEIVAQLELDSPPAQRDPYWGEWLPTDVFYILMHMISETATHAGHMDVARELIDGRQHVVL